MATGNMKTGYIFSIGHSLVTFFHTGFFELSVLPSNLSYFTLTNRTIHEKYQGHLRYSYYTLHDRYLSNKENFKNVLLIKIRYFPVLR